MTDTLPSWRRLLNAVVISACLHLLLLISILEGYGGRSGPFSLPGIVMVELVPSGFHAADTSAAEPTPFPAPSLNNLATTPAPTPSLTSFASSGDQRQPAAKKTDDEEVSGGDRPGFKSGRGGASAVNPPESSLPPAEPETGAGHPRRPGSAPPETVEPESRGPRCASCPDPGYPPLALKRGLEGEVVLNVQVLDDGRVGDIFVEKSSGYPLLDEAALTAVKGWSFYPAADRERPIAATLTVKVPFRLTPP